MSAIMRRACVIGYLGFVGGCSSQLSEATTAVSQQATPAVFNVQNAPTVEFSIPDMMCEEGCGAATREILAEQEGVRDVKVDFPTKVVVVAVDEANFDADQALADLIDHGFDNSTLKTVQ